MLIEPLAGFPARASARLQPLRLLLQASRNAAIRCSASVPHSSPIRRCRGVTVISSCNVEYIESARVLVQSAGRAILGLRERTFDRRPPARLCRSILRQACRARTIARTRAAVTCCEFYWPR